ncbi:MAG: hypothetical protein AAF903_12035 [Pseudomonadota bacterium]
MFIKVNPTQDRRRGGISFRAQQELVIDCEKLKVSKKQAEAILGDPVLRAVECDRDGLTDVGGQDAQPGNEPEVSSDVRAKRLAVLVELASQEPALAMVIEALGFDVSADELDAAWHAKVSGEVGEEEDDAAKLRAYLEEAHKADASKKPTVVTASAELGFAVKGPDIAAIWTDLSQ